MKPLQSPESLAQNCGGLVEKDATLLQQAVEKLVRFGQRVGVAPEEMISLLDSGISPRPAGFPSLEVIRSRLDGVVSPFHSLTLIGQFSMSVNACSQQLRQITLSNQ